MKALVGAFNQEKALVGAFSVIVQPVVEPMEHYTALVTIKAWLPSQAAQCQGRRVRAAKCRAHYHINVTPPPGPHRGHTSPVLVCPDNVNSEGNNHLGAGSSVLLEEGCRIYSSDNRVVREHHIYLIHVTRLAVCEAAMLELVASPPRAAGKEGTLLPKVENRTKIVIRHKTI